MREETIGDIVILNEEGPRVSIYGIREDDISPYVYIGSTTDRVRRRIRGHWSDAHKGSHLPIHQWMVERKFKFEVVVLETVSEDIRHARERFWVVTHGGALLNVTDGGPGMSGHRFAGTEHADNIARAVRTGDEFHCLTCGTLFWRKRKEIIKGNNKFCSRRCYADALKGRSKPVPRSCTEKGVAAAAALRLARTHCKHGHPFSGDNLRTNRHGARLCKACGEAARARYKAKVAVNV